MLRDSFVAFNLFINWIFGVCIGFAFDFVCALVWLIVLLVWGCLLVVFVVGFSDLEFGFII